MEERGPWMQGGLEDLHRLLDQLWGTAPDGTRFVILHAEELERRLRRKFWMGAVLATVVSLIGRMLIQAFVTAMGWA